MKFMFFVVIWDYQILKTHLDILNWIKKLDVNFIFNKIPRSVYQIKDLDFNEIYMTVQINANFLFLIIFTVEMSFKQILNKFTPQKSSDSNLDYFHKVNVLCFFFLIVNDFKEITSSYLRFEFRFYFYAVFVGSNFQKDLILSSQGNFFLLKLCFYLFRTSSEMILYFL